MKYYLFAIVLLILTILFNIVLPFLIDKYSLYLILPMDFLAGYLGELLWGKENVN